MICGGEGGGPAFSHTIGGPTPILIKGVPFPPDMLPPAFTHARFFPGQPEIRNVHSSINLWSEQIAQGETVVAVLMMRGSTLILTRDRLLELVPHLDDFGFWNVKRFEGYEARLDVKLAGTEIMKQQSTEGGLSVTLGTVDGERTLVLEPWHNLTTGHIEQFVKILTESVRGRT